MNLSGITLTATDTDAGKTYLTTLILKALQEAGKKAVGYKPVSCGDRQDARQLLALAPEGVLLDEMNPLFYKNSTSPYTAALLENRETPSLEALCTQARLLEKRFGFVVAEGIGGWETPFSLTETFSHLAQKLDYPVILIVENKLGMLNHALLSLRAIQSSGAHCLGVIINTKQEEWDTATLTNRGILPDLLSVPILGEIIHGQDFLDIDPLLDALQALG